MRKSIFIFCYITLGLGLLGVIISTIYFCIHMTALTQLVLIALGGQDVGNDLGINILSLIIFLLLIVYFVFTSLTALLFTKVIKNNNQDKIKHFSILSIIFFNPFGGIISLVDYKRISKELERTSPKGKRKDINKN